MASIFPEANNGGTIVRDGDGQPIPVTNVPNSYVPPASFGTSCDLTYLYNDCFSRISPAQINAMQSEMLCFATWLDPEGSWDCDSLCNISTAMENFISRFQGAQLGDQLCIVPQGTGTEAAPFLIYCSDGTVMKLPISGPDSLLAIMFQSLCGTDVESPNSPAARVLYCDDTGEIKSASVFSLQYYRGDYIQAYAYLPSQMVKRNDRLYSPNADIPAGTPFVIGTTGATWKEVSAPAIPPHDSALAYKKDQIVSRNGNLYAANDDIPEGTPFSVGSTGQTWRLVNFSEAHILEFDPLKTYTRYSVVTRNGLIYRATNAEVAASPWDASKWERIGGEKNVLRGPYDPTLAYLKDDIVLKDGDLYSANENIPANTPFQIGTSGQTWSQVGKQTKGVEIALSITQGWAQDETLAVYVVTTPFTLEQDLPGSRVSSISQNPLNTSLKLMKNGTLVGAVSFTNGDALLSFENDVQFVAGDTLSFGSETTTAFDYVAVTLVGKR